jgi:ZIP family zinc transporter
VPGHETFGVVYGLISGMMSYISLCELLPSARQHDPRGRDTAVWLLAGFALMSAALVLMAFVEDGQHPM